MRVTDANDTEEGTPAEPERTCVACRRRDERDALVRFVRSPDGDELVPDLGHRLSGRGVSVHPTRRCLLDAAKHGFARALRAPISLDGEGVVRMVATSFERRTNGLLLAAMRRRKLVLGTDAVREAMRRGGVEALVIAADAEGRRDELARGMERLGGRAVVYSTKEGLGKLFGRNELGVLGILDSGIASEVVRHGGRAAELSEAE